MLNPAATAAEQQVAREAIATRLLNRAAADVEALNKDASLVAKLKEEMFDLAGVVPANLAKVLPTKVLGIPADRVTRFNRSGFQNYRLETNAGTPENPIWRVYYHGYIAPNETAVAITRRHAGTVGPDGLARFNPAVDRIVMEPGTRLYGEARLMKHRRIVQDGTNIGRIDISGSRRGNN